MKKAVIFCTCCDTLSPVLAPASLAQSLSSRGNSVFLTSPRLCRREDAQAALKTAREAGVEALVVGACSHSARGREAILFLNDGLPLELVDIRENCAFIHGDNPEQAAAKACDLLSAGLAAHEVRSSRTYPTSSPYVPCTKALVIGGGPAGLACAAALGSMGVSTVLAERRAAPGGMLTQLGILFPSFTSGPELAQKLTRDVEKSGAQICLDTTVTSIHTAPEGYRAVLRGKSAEEEQTFGAVVFATGALPVLPQDLYRYKELAGVISQMEFEVALGKVERGEEKADALPSKAVFIQCVAARDEKNPYCSAICCPTALKNALRLRKLNPGGTVTVLHRNIVTPGIHLEEMYRRATAEGVTLRNYTEGTTPVPEGSTGIEGIRFIDALDGREYLLPADRLVCSTPLKPAPAAAQLAKGLGIRFDNMGFACGREPILPLSSHSAGVFVCGTARWPVITEQSLQQGRAVAVQAKTYLQGLTAAKATALSTSVPHTLRALQPEHIAPGQSACIRTEACSGCGRCAAACPYGACVLSEEGTAHVLAVRCARCGACAAVCPCGAANLPEENLHVMRARVKESLGGMSV